MRNKSMRFYQNKNRHTFPIICSCYSLVWQPHYSTLFPICKQFSKKTERFSKRSVLSIIQVDTRYIQTF